MMPDLMMMAPNKTNQQKRIVVIMLSGMVFWMLLGIVHFVGRWTMSSVVVVVVATEDDSSSRASQSININNDLSQLLQRRQYDATITAATASSSTSTAYYEPRLLICGMNGTVQMTEARTGRRLGSFTTQRPMMTTATLEALGHVVVPSWDGLLYFLPIDAAAAAAFSSSSPSSSSTSSPPVMAPLSIPHLLQHPVRTCTTTTTTTTKPTTTTTTTSTDQEQQQQQHVDCGILTATKVTSLWAVDSQTGQLKWHRSGTSNVTTPTTTPTTVTTTTTDNDNHRHKKKNSSSTLLLLKNGDDTLSSSSSSSSSLLLLLQREDYFIQQVSVATGQVQWNVSVAHYQALDFPSATTTTNTATTASAPLERDEEWSSQLLLPSRSNPHHYTTPTTSSPSLPLISFGGDHGQTLVVYDDDDHNGKESATNRIVLWKRNFGQTISSVFGINALQQWTALQVIASSTDDGDDDGGDDIEANEYSDDVRGDYNNVEHLRQHSQQQQPRRLLTNTCTVTDDDCFPSFEKYSSRSSSSSSSSSSLSLEYPSKKSLVPARLPYSSYASPLYQQQQLRFFPRFRHEYYERYGDDNDRKLQGKQQLLHLDIPSFNRQYHHDDANGKPFSSSSSSKALATIPTTTTTTTTTAIKQATFDDSYYYQYSHPHMLHDIYHHPLQQQQQYANNNNHHHGGMLSNTVGLPRTVPLLLLPAPPPSPTSSGLLVMSWTTALVLIILWMIIWMVGGRWWYLRKKQEWIMNQPSPIEPTNSSSSSGPEGTTTCTSASGGDNSRSSSSNNNNSNSNNDTSKELQYSRTPPTNNICVAADGATPLVNATSTATTKFETITNTSNDSGAMAADSATIVNHRAAEIVSPPRGTTDTVGNDGTVLVDGIIPLLRYSRYKSEFRQMEPLGRGGFGSVVRCQNVLDGREYAIKRIVIDDNYYHEKEVEDAEFSQRLHRVLREVKSLALLDHVNIVRYYTAWLEHSTIHDDDDEDDEQKVHDSYYDGGVGGPPTMSVHKLHKTNHHQKKKKNDFGNNNNLSWMESSSLANMTAAHRRPSGGGTTTSSWSVKSTSVLGRRADHPKNWRYQQQQLPYDESFSSSLRHSINHASHSRLSSWEEYGFTFQESQGGGGDNEEEAGQKSILSTAIAADVPEVGNTGDGSHEDSRSTTVGDNSHTETRRPSQRPLATTRGGAPVQQNSVQRSTSPPVRRTLYIQMQLCSQKTLADFLSNAEARRGPSRLAAPGCVDIPYALSLFHQIAQGVQHVHRQGLIHRDLKPNNCFIDEGGVVKVGDFGLSREASSSSSTALNDFSENKAIIMAGQVVVGPDEEFNTAGVGTRSYASPEQMNGSDYDSSTDVYSLGIMLFELCYPMYTGMERHIVFSKLRALELPPQWQNQVASSFPALHNLVLAMLSPRPRKRPSADAVVQQIQSLLGEITILSLDHSKREDGSFLLRVEATPTEGVLRRTMQRIQEAAPDIEIVEYGLRGGNQTAIMEFALAFPEIATSDVNNRSSFVHRIVSQIESSEDVRFVRQVSSGFRVTTREC